MNVTKFLALKIAEAALALADDAEHIAESHSTDPIRDAPCYESLKESGGRLALIMLTAASNGVIPHGTVEEGEVLKQKVREELSNEIVNDINARRLVLDRSLVL